MNEKKNSPDACTPPTIDFPLKNNTSLLAPGKVEFIVVGAQETVKLQSQMERALYWWRRIDVATSSASIPVKRETLVKYPTNGLFVSV